jgi:hypothetical protein
MLTLAITGFDVDPDRVTDLLQLTPTEVGRKEIPGRSGRPKSFNGWWLEAHEDRLNQGSQHETALNRILVQLRGKENLFAQLREAFAPKNIAIYGGLYLRPTEQCGVWLEPDQMRLLADCGIGWGLDLFIEDKPA